MISHQDLHLEIYEKLIEIAKAGSVTYYSDIAPLAGLDMSDPDHRNQIASILGRISTYEHQLGHPMLSAVVLLKDKNSTGEGFFTLAEELGLHDGIVDDDRFLMTELAKVYEHWNSR